MAVTTVVTVTTMTAMMAVTAASEGLTRDRQRSSRQRQSSDSGNKDVPDSDHERLPWLCRARIALR
jgi:hypothetical protein